jgi:trk system potassium uptake protein
MNYGVILKVLGILLMLFSTAYLIPLVVSLFHNDGSSSAFIYSLVITMTLGACLWIPFSREQRELRSRDGFLITVLFWMVLGIIGSLPLILSAEPHLSVTDSIFESISGLTTTGATVIGNLDELPVSILFYRQMLQWLGGIGIVVIALAILPMLGIGGMQLYRAEVPGPVKDAKLTPRIGETAKALFFVYLILTIACAVAYRLGGMSSFDAIAHSFSTVSIGGFSTHDASMGYFLNNPDYNGNLILSICIFFTVLSGLNFGLHYVALFRLSLRHYLKDSEAKAYLMILGTSAIFVTLGLMIANQFESSTAVLQGVFHTVSIMTTAGFTASDLSSWPEHIAFFLIFLSFFGACAASTGGGIKIGRMIILARQTLREITRLIHPSAVVPIKVGNRPVDTRIADAIWGFFGAYLIVFYAMILVLLASGLDYVTAWSAVAATLNNLGPGLGEVTYSYASIPDFSKWVLCFSMILGRLELFTLIVLFVPMFWQK